VGVGAWTEIAAELKASCRDARLAIVASRDTTVGRGSVTGICSREGVHFSCVSCTDDSCCELTSGQSTQQNHSSMQALFVSST